MGGYAEDEESKPETVVQPGHGSGVSRVALVDAGDHSRCPPKGSARGFSAWCKWRVYTGLLARGTGRGITPEAVRIILCVERCVISYESYVHAALSREACVQLYRGCVGQWEWEGEI